MMLRDFSIMPLNGALAIKCAVTLSTNSPISKAF